VLGIFHFDTVFRPDMELNQPPIQLIMRPISLGVKWRWREADHSHPSYIEVKECVEL